MIFIHPMWDSENQRLGMKACTPMGYMMRGIGDVIGFFGLILLFFILGYLVYRFIRHQFSSSDFWLLLAPIIIGFVGRLFFLIGWWLASKNHFRYDYDTRIARWIEAGREKVYPEQQRQ